jgi:uncharacterized integral membrane protein
MEKFLIPLIITIVVFLIARELVMWYWKINRIVSLQEQILAELKKMNK